MRTLFRLHDVPGPGVATSVAVVGGVLRLRQFLSGRSLWMDEAMLALNVVSRPLSGLLQPLDSNQGAPLGFLVLQKFASILLGETDLAMRVVPLLASLIALVLFARVAVTWIGSTGALAALLFAIAPSLVEYSTEAKQYSVDVAATVGVLAALAPWAALRSRTAQDWAVFGLAGALAPWFSHPAAFVLPGAGFVVLWRAIADRSEELPRVLLVAIAWVSSFALLYMLSLRGLSANAVLLAYWKTSFAPPGGPELRAWALAMLTAYGRDVVGLATGVTTVLVLALGTWSLMVRRFDLAVAAILPLAAAFAASAFRLYPFSGRMLLFAVPTTLLLVAEGVRAAGEVATAALSRWTGTATVRRVVVAAFSVVVLASPVARSWRLALHPRNPEALRPALEYMLGRRDPEEPIYVYYAAKPAVNFYVRSLPIPADRLVPGRAHRQDPGAYREEVRALRTSPGAWVVFSHACPGCPADEWQVILDELDGHGRRVESFETEGAAVHRYRFDRPPGDSTEVPTSGR